MTIICHVSDEKHKVLMPQEPTNAICFSEDTFITYFGQYLYLFDLDLMRDVFQLEKLPTTGITGLQELGGYGFDLDDIILRYKSRSLELEWRCYQPVDVDKYALGVIEHWNHMDGVIGKGAVSEAMSNIAIDLLSKQPVDDFAIPVNLAEHL